MSISCSRAARSTTTTARSTRPPRRWARVLNAYTSHDLVAFHITCRAEVAAEAIDLLTDFVGRPKIDAEELDRERGVVIQEIARAQDQPSVLAEHLIDRAAFGDHPLGRPVLGPEEHLRTFSRDAILAFRRRQWVGSRGGAFLVGNLDHLPENSEMAELFGRFPSISANGGVRAGAGRSRRRRWWRRASPPSRTCGCPTGRRSTRAPPPSAPRWAVYSTLLGGSMGSRLFDEIREQRGLAYSVYAIDHTFADVPILQLSAGLDSTKCVEAYTRMREIVDELRTDGPTEEEVERARAYAAGRRVLAFENTNAVARHAASQTVIFGQDIDPDKAIEALDAVTYDQVVEVARGISEELSVAVRRPPYAGRVLITSRLLRWPVRRPQWLLGDTSRSSTTASSSATCAGSRTGGRWIARCWAARASLTCAAPARSASAARST